jgi:hypothetical protein
MSAGDIWLKLWSTASPIGPDASGRAAADFFLPKLRPRADVEDQKEIGPAGGQDRPTRIRRARWYESSI